MRGQINAFLAETHEFETRLFVAGPVTQAERRAAPLPLHTTPISERNMVRLWHRLDSPWPPVAWFTGGPLALFHATDFALPPHGAQRSVLTIHDLAFVHYPEVAMPSLHRYLNVVVPRSVRRADYIIADSHSTARDLESLWGVEQTRLAVVQGGVDHTHFRPNTDPVRHAEVRHRYAVGDGPFILAVSRLEPRKNHVRLIQAYARARAQARIPHRLVIGGRKGWLYDEIFAEVTNLGLQDAVSFPGFIADEDLPVLYSAADFVAYPSLYEGFGLPIIEALACGAPVLTADNSCLPEAGGPGALYVNALDVDQIAAAIVRLADDVPLRAQLAHAGLQHATQFTWQRSARQLIAAYHAALS